jgi:hypothetical protein
VQGQLRNEKLTFTIQTSCNHCQAPIGLEIDSDLNYRLLDPGSEPLIFVPMVDFARLEDPSIIDAF